MTDWGALGATAITLLCLGLAVAQARGRVPSLWQAGDGVEMLFIWALAILTSVAAWLGWWAGRTG